jgi:hypothetical protein
MYLFQPFKSFEIGGRDPKPGLYFLTLLPQLEIKAKNMLADSIADEPARCMFTRFVSEIPVMTGVCPDRC